MSPPPYKPVTTGTNPNGLVTEVVMVKLGDGDPWPARIKEGSEHVELTRDGEDLIAAVTVYGGPKGGESWRTVPVSALRPPTAKQRRSHAG